MQKPNPRKKGKLFAIGMIFLWLAMIAGVIMVMVQMAEELEKAGLL